MAVLSAQRKRAPILQEHWERTTRYVQSKLQKARLIRYQAAILMNHGLITVGSTVDEAGFLFSSLDRHCEIQLKIEAACAGNPSLRKHIISDEEAAYNFKMQSTPDWLYVEAQPDLEYEIEMAGGIGIIGRDVDLMEVDEDLYGASEPDEE